MLIHRASAEQARLEAEGLRTAFSLQKIEGLPDTERLTASFGISAFKHSDTSDALFKRADAALYKAKATGRDRVVMCDFPHTIKATAAAYTRRSTIMRFTSAIALAGFKPFGHACVQFMIVWQR